MLNNHKCSPRGSRRSAPNLKLKADANKWAWFDANLMRWILI